LSGADVAQVLEALMGLAQRTGAVRVRTGPKDVALREARICYDHLAGEAGVTLFNGLTARNYLEHSEQDALQLTSEGREFFSGLGLELKPLESKRR
ncbi:transcriptional regulator, partial [Ochrobactrum sp. SFR4]|nr:transcriptional regulator [Ochrobactrum sp. SFR4]